MPTQNVRERELLVNEEDLRKVVSDVISEQVKIMTSALARVQASIDHVDVQQKHLKDQLIKLREECLDIGSLSSRITPGGTSSWQFAPGSGCADSLPGGEHLRGQPEVGNPNSAIFTVSSEGPVELHRNIIIEQVGELVKKHCSLDAEHLQPDGNINPEMVSISFSEVAVKGCVTGCVTIADSSVLGFVKAQTLHFKHNDQSYSVEFSPAMRLVNALVVMVEFPPYKQNYEDLDKCGRIKRFHNPDKEGRYLISDHVNIPAIKKHISANCKMKKKHIVLCVLNGSAECAPVPAKGVSLDEAIPYAPRMKPAVEEIKEICSQLWSVRKKKDEEVKVVEVKQFPIDISALAFATLEDEEPELAVGNEFHGATTKKTFVHVSEANHWDNEAFAVENRQCMSDLGGMKVLKPRPA